KVLDVGYHVSLVPGLLEIATMVYGDAVQPGPPTRFTPELAHFAKRFNEHIMGGVLSLLRVRQQAQGEVINRAMSLVEQLAKFRGLQGQHRLFSPSGFFQRVAHNGVHIRLDRRRQSLSRWHLRDSILV